MGSTLLVHSDVAMPRTHWMHSKSLFTIKMLVCSTCPDDIKMPQQNVPMQKLCMR